LQRDGIAVLDIEPLRIEFDKVEKGASGLTSVTDIFGNAVDMSYFTDIDAFIDPYQEENA
jgi:hypothetical protein